MSTAPIVPARRCEQFQYAVRDVVLAARQAVAQGKQLISLNIGDPNQFDFRTPPHIVDAICRAIRDGYTSYAPSEGLPEALEAIRSDAQRRCGIDPVLDVFVGNGSSECIEVALAALVNEGEGVLVPSPGYPFYSAVLAKLGCREVAYALDESRGWQPDVDKLAATIDASTRAIVVVNPNNPTGAVCERSTLEAIVELAARHDLVVFADEIYDRLLLDATEHTALASLTDEVPIVTFSGLSKAFLGPGLRLGWGIVSGPGPRMQPLIAAIHKFLRARLSASHPVQHAVVPALTGDDAHLQQTVDKLRRRRDLTISRLSGMQGISCVPPAAAFYAFPRLHDLGGRATDEQWVRELVLDTGVLAVHGSGFGQELGTAHFRVVFLATEDLLREAFDRIEAFMAR